MSELTINRTYKDRLFRLAFQDKQDLLDLYNAVSGRHYTDPGELVITTLADAIYLGMKNDISFLVYDSLNLYEHQSSFNPNMPIRGFNYFAEAYREFIDANHLDVYAERLVRLPMPQYIVFYNGTREAPDRVELRLSDAFLCKDPAEKGCLECRATMININYGHNNELLEHCKRLKDYAIFVHRVRENGNRGMNLKDAVDQAVTACIDEGILADILSKNRSEVYNLILYGYDEEKQLAIARENAMIAGRKEGWEKGREEGWELGKEQEKAAIIRKMLDKGMNPQTISDLLELDENYVSRVEKLLKESEGRSDYETARILLGLE